jgi:DUF2075 family protein
MAYGFSGSINDFIDLARQGAIGHILSRTRQVSGGHPLSSEVQAIWDEDALVLANFLLSIDIPQEETYFMLNEYDIPGHLGRYDVVMLGADAQATKHASVFELKRWLTFSASHLRSYVTADGALHLHPSEQALQYRDRLQVFHEMGREYAWHAGAWMTAMEPGYVSELQRIAPPEAAVWCLTSPDARLVDEMRNWFVGGLAESNLSAFRDGRCVPDAKLAENLLVRLPGLTRGLFAALGGQPIDLSPRQEEIVTTILAEIQRKERVLILVSGSPGCGKTVVGLHAIAHQLARNIDPITRTIRTRAVLALRNNRLCTVVRAAIDEVLQQRVGRALVQYVGGRPGVGIHAEVLSAVRRSDDDSPLYDLVVVDEAHRVPNETQPIGGLSQVDAVLRAGRAVVCLLDEGQILNEDDNGDRQTFIESWKKLFPNAPIVELELNEQHRLPKAYSDWLEEFLRGSTKHPPVDYVFRLASSPEELVEYLRSNSETNDCGLLASYTFSNGRRGKTARVPSLGIHWLMDKEDYNLWWRDRTVRHRFDRCASVYGCQGFELDYAGLFWGRDLAVRRTASGLTFDLCEPHDVKDDIQLAYGRRLRKMADEAVATGDVQLRQDVVRRLINRYRILLSRGRKGTIIYCEEPETAEALRTLLESPESERIN